MFKNITDITMLECLNNMHLDLVAAGKANANDKELVADITEALKKILKNKKINLLSAGILYRYVDGCIEAFSLTKYLAPQDVATELFSEWHHIKYWIENHYTVNNSNDLISLSERAMSFDKILLEPIKRMFEEKFFVLDDLEDQLDFIECQTSEPEIKEIIKLCDEGLERHGFNDYQLKEVLTLIDAFESEAA